MQKTLHFPAEYFPLQEDADRWIEEHTLSGTLAAYPLDVSVYRWAVENGFYSASKPVSAHFIGRFSSAHQPHYHFENGHQEGRAVGRDL